jgi:4-hydroxy-tetrahydrodipicolinate synthase
MAKELMGIIPPMVTPLTKDQEVDYANLKNLTSWLIEHGVHGLLTLGGAGEIQMFTESERNKIAKTVIDEANGKVPVLVGTSHYSTNAAIKMSKDAQDMGADGLVLIEPWGGPATDVLEYYKRINDAVDSTLCLYTHFMSIDMIKKCAALNNLRYVKEGNTSMNHCMQLVKELGKNRVFAGSTAMMFRQMVHGLQGAVMGENQVWPESAVELFNTIRTGDLDKARRLYYEKHLPLVEFCSLGGGAGSVAWHTQTIKTALAARGIIENDIVRGPQQQIDETTKRELLLWLDSKGLTGKK